MPRVASLLWLTLYCLDNTIVQRKLEQMKVKVLYEGETSPSGQWPTLKPYFWSGL